MMLAYSCSAFLLVWCNCFFGLVSSATPPPLFFSHGDYRSNLFDALMRHVAIRSLGMAWHDYALDLYNNPRIDLHCYEPYRVYGAQTFLLTFFTGGQFLQHCLVHVAVGEDGFPGWGVGVPIGVLFLRLGPQGNSAPSSIICSLSQHFISHQHRPLNSSFGPATSLNKVKCTWSCALRSKTANLGQLLCQFRKCWLPLYLACGNSQWTARRGKRKNQKKKVGEAEICTTYVALLKRM